VLLLSLGLALGRPAPLEAQCPDGTPPPCAGRAVRALDPRGWVVLPFDNVSRDPASAWLADATANLLYLNLSRWQDLRVVDDERVADAVRRLPAAQRGAIGLATGLAVARGFGAARLVIGDLLRVGSRTEVVAKIYDAASGRRVRDARAGFEGPEAMMAAYARLAAAIVGVSPLAGEPSAVGTASLAAYREYAAGVRALHHRDVTTARARFTEALRHDSAFALAHYKLSAAILCDVCETDSAVVRHAELALRFAEPLPARERALVRGQYQMAQHRWSEACATFAALVAADSTDAEAWYRLGDCNYHDDEVRPVPGDSGRLEFVSSWTTARRALRTAFELDPTRHSAFGHLLDMLDAERRRGCLRAPCTGALLALAAVEVRGDSIVTEPMRAGAPELAARVAAARVAREQAALATAEQLVALSGGAAEAHDRLARSFAAMRRYADAAREFAAAQRLGIDSRVSAPLDLARLLIAAGQIDEAGRVVDSLLPSGDGGVALVRATAAGTFGMFRRMPARGEWTFVDMPADYWTALAVLAAGADPGDRPLEAAALTVREPALREAVLATIGDLGFGVRSPSEAVQRSAWRDRALARLWSGDTAGARARLRVSDGLLLAATEERHPLRWLASALAHVALGDTTTALARLEEMERTWRRIFGYWENAAFPQPGWVLGRAWLLTADLRRARGQRDEAVRLYRRVVDLWSRGDVEVQPFVARAREALATLR